MSSARPGLPGGLTPPPLPPSTPGKRARVKARPGGNPPEPPPVEFLPEEFVLEDVEDYEELPAELLIEEEPSVVFAGPSDAPPRPETAAYAATAEAARSRVEGDPQRRRWLRTGSFSVAACLALLVATTARWGGLAQHRSSTEKSASDSTPLAPGAERAASSSDPSDVPLVGPAASAAPAPPAEAAEKKNASQQALEHGKVGLSIELGERAVQLDPTDADSWLILGAGYMQRGDNKNARRCFTSCVEKATTGERKECAAMMR
jgi:cytochrome c-type biogenesis protein CcmH/NrfG